MFSQQFKVLSFKQIFEVSQVLLGSTICIYMRYYTVLYDTIIRYDVRIYICINQFYNQTISFSPIKLAGVELERIPSTLLTSQKYSPVSLYNTDGML